MVGSQRTKEGREGGTFPWRRRPHWPLAHYILRARCAVRAFHVGRAPAGTALPALAFQCFDRLCCPAPGPGPPPPPEHILIPPHPPAPAAAGKRGRTERLLSVSLSPGPARHVCGEGSPPCLLCIGPHTAPGRLCCAARGHLACGPPLGARTPAARGATLPRARGLAWLSYGRERLCTWCKGCGIRSLVLVENVYVPAACGRPYRCSPFAFSGRLCGGTERRPTTSTVASCPHGNGPPAPCG